MDFFRETDVIFANTNVLCKKATFPVDKLENMFEYMTFHSMKTDRLGTDKELRSRQGTFLMYKKERQPWIIMCLSAYNAGPEFKFNKISKHRADRTFNDEHEQKLAIHTCFPSIPIKPTECHLYLRVSFSQNP